MSHNTIKVDGLAPDSTSKFVTKEYIQYGKGETPSSPSITLSNGTNYPFYDTSPINTIVGATLNQAGDTLTSIDLPAGKYIIYLNLGAVAVTSGTVWLTYSLIVPALVSGTDYSYSNISQVVGNDTINSMRSYAPTPEASYLFLTSDTNLTVTSGIILSITTRSSSSARYAETSSLTILKME